MKKLLLITLVLCSIGMFGQMDTILIDENVIITPSGRILSIEKINELLNPANIYNNNPHLIPYIESNDFDYNGLTDKDIINVILSSYNEYSQECYNDSAYKCGYVTIWEKNKSYGWSDYQCNWIHKEPTFTDFMEWLKNKYK